MEHPPAPISEQTVASLTLPGIADYHRAHNPHHTYAVFPGDAPSAPPRRVTFLEFGRAVARFARAVRPRAPSARGEVVGLIAHCDSLLYVTAMAGFMRAGLAVRAAPHAGARHALSGARRCSRCPRATRPRRSATCCARWARTGSW
jgi:acyl-CoA synthetase (AMP-forming)/AMP-acid ligase II